MTILVKCQCGSRLKVPAALLGKAATCGSCRKHVRLVAGEPLSSDEKPNASLIIQRGPLRAGEQIVLAGGTSIEVGAAASRHLVISGDHIERLHSTLTPVNGKWRLDDQHSAIGTYVNGERVTSRELRDGDLLDIGAYELKFVQTAPAPTKPRVEPKIQVVASDDFLFTSAPPMPEAVLKRSGLDDDVIQLEEEDEELVNFEPVASESAEPKLIEAKDAPDDLYDFADPDEPAKPPPFIPPPPIVPMPGHEIPMSTRVAAGQMSPVRAVRATPTMADIPQGPQTGGPICPSCDKSLPPGAKFCISCGIHVKTGRPLITAKGWDEDDMAIRADTWIRITSWLVPLGLFPIASEAYGTRKPYATWTIAAITIFMSVFYFIATNVDEDNPALLNLMHWSGSGEATLTAAEIAQIEDEINRKLTAREIAELQEMIAAPEGVGFRWYQLLTCALLHGDLFHLAGNLLFLLVFGLRVNELIGNAKMAFVYPLLAVASSLIDMTINYHLRLHASLGASGAIMGLAGMYFVFFPVQRVHMAIWFRGGMLTGWRCFYKLFTMRGFWLLLLWVLYNDVLPTVLGTSDNVGHWAHLGGFASGMLVALGLLVVRQTNARGGDVLSVVLGKYAWPLIGKPSRWKDDVPASMLATRAVSLNYPGS